MVHSTHPKSRLLAVYACFYGALTNKERYLKNNNNKPDSEDRVLELVRLINLHLLDGVSVTELAKESGKSQRTIWRRIQEFQNGGVEALKRKERTDKGKRRVVDEQIVLATEGFCLKRPKPSLTWVHKEITKICKRDGLDCPSYTTIRNIYNSINPQVSG